MCHMTCQELRLYFEDPLRHDRELRPDLEHLAHCPDCARFVEQQRELGAGLRLIREAAPRIPASLDLGVLASYRRHFNEQRNPAEAPRKRGFAVLQWGAAAAALLLIAGVLLWPGQKPVAVARPPLPPTEIASQAHPAAVEATAPLRHAVKKKASHALQRTLSPAPALDAASNQLPPGFRSLMYCDEFSCGDALEVIRVQLPPAAAALSPAAISGGGPVFADVLVGPDGIARGIRVVE
jgi:hypothetical protein